ncbi:hypothetical protein [Streptomyces sp. HB132]|uniref:hypothetical protein n=1 Tax=Streptomyces sp. HB132 TaxID=767388 RepID=UPI0027DE8D79|nr:hypothetical protein [Streptomyces sp. HB132]
MQEGRGRWRHSGGVIERGAPVRAGPAVPGLQGPSARPSDRTDPHRVREALRQGLGGPVRVTRPRRRPGPTRPWPVGVRSTLARRLNVVGSGPAPPRGVRYCSAVGGERPTAVPYGITADRHGRTRAGSNRHGCGDTPPHRHRPRGPGFHGEHRA